MAQKYKAIHDYGDGSPLEATGDTPAEAVKNVQAAVDAEYEKHHGHPVPSESAEFVLKRTLFYLDGVQVGRVIKI